MTVDAEKLVSFHEMSKGRRHFTRKKHLNLIFWNFSKVESHN